MTDLHDIKVYKEAAGWVVLQCFDDETSDLFEDFLVEELEVTISRKFEIGVFYFFFGPEFNEEQVVNLFLRFKQKDA